MNLGTANDTLPPKKAPLIFEEYFELGQQETLSPFITSKSRALSANLYLKASILSAVLLFFAFVFSFHSDLLPVSRFFLIAVYFLAGIPALIESIEDLANLEINIDILMTLAAFSSVIIGSGMEGGLLLVLFSLSGSMEDAVRSKAKSAIKELHKLSPSTAFVLREDGTLIERSVKEIAINSSILVKSGQIVPLDGKVIEGISSVNLVHLTGENFPVRKQLGDEVPAGAENLEGSLVLKVIKTSSDSTLSRIIQLVTQAQEARPRLQRWFDSVSNRYASAIILLSFFFALAFPLLLHIPFLGMEGSIYRALAFLIAASPCALIIALPIAYLSALSICAKNGILLKGGITLDALARCHTIAFDKTGTLTTGDLTCSGVLGLQESSQEEETLALATAYALEKGAIHPIAKAILSYVDGKNISPQKLDNFKAVPGFGLQGEMESSKGKELAYIGSADYILDKIPEEKKEQLLFQVEEIQKNGELLSVLVIGKNVYLFKFRDTIRPQMKKTLEALKQKWRLALVMLTGDHEVSAKRTAKELGIENFFHSLKPEDKLAHVTELSQKSGLAMIGDGINDAPALARATVGICMGQVGTTTAMEASDVVLLQDNIETLDWLIGKAKKTQRIVKQNLSLAIAAIFLASIPALAGLVPLWLAVVMHEGGTVLVGLNALRLLKN